MNFKKTGFIICFFSLFIFLVNIYGQDNKVPEKKTDTASSIVKTDIKVKDDNKVVFKVHEKKEKAPVLKKEDGKAELKYEPIKPGDGLLMIKDGDYKYKRIPEIKLDKKEVEEEEIVKISDSEKAVIKTEEKEPEGTGLFGLSKNTTDIIAKGSIVLLILLIFILYRFRSRKSDSSSVLRSLPKK